MITEEQLDLLTRLFQNRYGLVCAVVRRYAPAGDLVEDIVQETYLEFISKAAEKEWDLSRDIGPILCQIAKRKAQWLWRKHCLSRRSIELLADRLLAAYDEIPGMEPGMEYVRIDQELRFLKTCMQKMPLKSRELFERHYFHSIPMKEIALQEGTRSGTIRNFFFRMRVKLRECIEKSIRLAQTDEHTDARNKG